jgi:hypothetical protein
MLLYFTIQTYHIRRAKLLSKRRQYSQAGDRRLCAMFEPQLFVLQVSNQQTMMLIIVVACTRMQNGTRCYLS